MRLIWLKAIAQLGIRQTSLFALYQLERKTGFLGWKTRASKQPPTGCLENILPLPEADQLRATLGEEGLNLLYTEADEIVSGKSRLFGGEPVKINLVPPPPLKHWTRCRDEDLENQDIKFIWEPARFGWATILARAYFLRQDERYTSTFWKYTEIFLENNPAYLGVNWISAQEAALRLVSLAFAYTIFASSPQSTTARVSRLAETIAEHATRIPPSLAYSRAQNNNHLLTEAMGLLTAAKALPSHPSTRHWFALGWKWFHKGLKDQIASDGSYNQHSTNYHRLMLQAALWVHQLWQDSDITFPKISHDRLAAATHWLLALLDTQSGHVPNLGPNDGAYILPFSVLPHRDFRPTLQAAGSVFLGHQVLPGGLWDEMGLWLQVKKPTPTSAALRTNEPPSLHEARRLGSNTPHVLQVNRNSWAYLRLAHFNSRPGHADQLHLDLWWQGLNLALDPGTYLYNAPAPWDNSLTSTLVHNTITINQQEQMRRVGKFLYLDWAQAEISSQEFSSDGRRTQVTARHNGYRCLGILHQRSVLALPEGWRVEDHLLPVNSKKRFKPFLARLHWLVPDWEWDLVAEDSSVNLRLNSPWGWISTKIQVEPSTQQKKTSSDIQYILTRAGQILAYQGEEAYPTNPTHGWHSPTYGMKVPALSFAIQTRSLLPITFLTHWNLHIE